MRTFQLTQKGKTVARAPTGSRNILLDYLAQPENKCSTFDQLALDLDKTKLKGLLQEARTKGWVEEMDRQDGGYV